MSTFSESILNSAGFLRERCKESIELYCPDCGGACAMPAPGEEANGVECPTCMRAITPFVKCTRCKESIAATLGVGDRACLSALAYRKGTHAPAFAPNETLWLYKHRPNGQESIAAESDLRQRFASDALDKTTLVRGPNQKNYVPACTSPEFRDVAQTRAPDATPAPPSRGLIAPVPTPSAPPALPPAGSVASLGTRAPAKPFTLELPRPAIAGIPLGIALGIAADFATPRGNFIMWLAVASIALLLIKSFQLFTLQGKYIREYEAGVRSADETNRVYKQHPWTRSTARLMMSTCIFIVLVIKQQSDMQGKNGLFAELFPDIQRYQTIWLNLESSAHLIQSMAANSQETAALPGGDGTPDIPEANSTPVSSDPKEKDETQRSNSPVQVNVAPDNPGANSTPVSSDPKEKDETQRSNSPVQVNVGPRSAHIKPSGKTWLIVDDFAPLNAGVFQKYINDIPKPSETVILDQPPAAPPNGVYTLVGLNFTIASDYRGTFEDYRNDVLNVAKLCRVDAMLATQDLAAAREFIMGSNFSENQKQFILNQNWFIGILYTKSGFYNKTGILKENQSEGSVIIKELRDVSYFRSSQKLTNSSRKKSRDSAGPELEPKDLLLSVNGLDVQKDGEYIGYSMLAWKKGDIIPIKFAREGQPGETRVISK